MNKLEWIFLNWKNNSVWEINGIIRGFCQCNITWRVSQRLRFFSRDDKLNHFWFNDEIYWKILLLFVELWVKFFWNMDGLVYSFPIKLFALPQGIIKTVKMKNIRRGVLYMYPFLQEFVKSIVIKSVWGDRENVTCSFSEMIKAIISKHKATMATCTTFYYNNMWRLLSEEALLVVQFQRRKSLSIN